MKKSIFGVFALALVASIGMSAAMANAKLPTTLPQGFTATADDEVAINGSNAALNGWQHYFAGAAAPDGTSRDVVYEDHNLALKASTQGHTGNAMLFERKSAVGEFVAYSYLTGVTPGQNYYIQAYVRGENAENAKLVFSVQEKQGAAENRYTTVNTVEVNKAGTEVSFSGTDEEWKKVAFTYTAASNGLDMRIKIQAYGVGDMYVDDITMLTASAATNTDLFQMMGLGNDGTSEDPATMPVLNSLNIASDSSDDDGKSLKLNHMDVYKTVFGVLPHNGEYKLSFKYKNVSGGTADRLSIRMDNGAEGYYAAGVSSTAGVADEEWHNYEYDFSSVTRDINWLGITSYGSYLIDELAITGTDEDGKTMQYIINGSFSGACIDGYTYGGNFNVAKQSDGTYAFASSSFSKDASSGARGYLKIDAASKLNAGETYTLSFDYRSGGASAGSVFYGNGWGSEEWNYKDICPLGQATTANWVHKEVQFTAREGSIFEIYGDAGIGWPTYFRNFSIVDAEGNDYIANKTLVAPEMILGEENLFNYGTFEGDVNYKVDDWTFDGNAYVYGLTFETLYESATYDATATYRKGDWKLIFRSTEEQPATATSKEITATASTVMIYKKMYYGEVKTTLLVGDKEIESDSKGMFELPAGTEKFRIKFTGIGDYASLKYIYVLSHTHDAAPTDESAYKVTQATCTENGGKCYTCAGCGNDVYVEKTAALGHDWKHETKAATCKDGYEKDVCTRCNAEQNVTVLPATGDHVYKTVVDKEATCTSNGMSHQECEVCGAKGNNSVIPKKDHHFENGACTECGAKDPDYVPDTSSSTDSGNNSSEVDGDGCQSAVGGSAVALFAMSLLAVGYFIKRKEN